MDRFALATLVALASSAPAWNEAAEVGSKAPELKPREWLNHKGKVSWAALKGRVIVVEKWNTR